MREVDELRPLTAGRLLAIWRESAREAEDPLERSLLSNARVLAECCWSQGEPSFPDSGAVLEELTTREMESLLGLLGGTGEAAQLNPAFDPARFQALREV